MNAIEMLREQYSKGEIDEAEFERAITYALNEQPRYCPHCGAELPLVPGGSPSCVCGWPDLQIIAPRAVPQTQDLTRQQWKEAMLKALGAPPGTPIDYLDGWASPPVYKAPVLPPMLTHLCAICGNASTYKCAYCSYEVCENEIASTDSKGWIHPCPYRGDRIRKFKSMSGDIYREGTFTGEDK